MEAFAHQATPEEQVRDVVRSFEAAIRAKDIESIVSHYAPDIVAFDAIAALQFKGREAYRKHWEACMTMCPGAMIFEIHDVEVAARDDLAFCHFLSRCGADNEGEQKVGWMRGTVGLRRMGDRWLIVHEHWSAPFDPESGKALFDLQP